MDFLLLIISISVSFDSFALGLTNYINKIEIPIRSSLLIGATSIIYTSIAMIFGKSLSHVFPVTLAKFAGFLMLFILGLYFAIKGMQKESESIDFEEPSENTIERTIEIIKEPSRGDLDHSGYIDLKEAFLIGIALSMDSFTTGIACAISGYTPIFLPMLVGVFQFAGLILGSMAGRIVSIRMIKPNRLIKTIPGVLMMFFAIFRLF